METKFTSGPWKVCFRSLNGVNVGFHIAASPHGSCRPLVDCSWEWSVAEAETEMLTANAYLISAAPDMRDALKDMLAGWQYIRQQHGDLYGVGWDRAEQKAIAALAKADGAS